MPPTAAHSLLHAATCALAAGCAAAVGCWWATTGFLLLPLLRMAVQTAAPALLARPPWLALDSGVLAALASGLPVAGLSAVLGCLLAAGAALAGGQGLRAAAAGAVLGMAAVLQLFPALTLLPPPTPLALLLAAGLGCGFGAAVGSLAWYRNRALGVALDSARAQGEQLARASEQLGRYLAPPVCAHLLAGGGAADAAPRRCWLTLCFADLQGFTRFSEGAEPETLTRVLNDYQQAMADLTLAHGGTLDKFMGDGVLVLSGAPVSAGRQADAVACVQLARAMHQRLAQLVLDWRHLGLVDGLAMRTGVHSGWCTVGSFGGGSSRSYTAIGGAVNLAARLEQAAQPGQVLLSRSTWALVRGEIACREVGWRQMKGLLEPVATFECADSPELPLVLDGPGASLTLGAGTDQRALAGWLEDTAMRLRRPGAAVVDRPKAIP